MKSSTREGAPIEVYGAPSCEFSESFVDGMRRRMAASFHKYGHVKDADGVDELASLEQRIARYRETGNIEWLIDAANFAMIEFMHPKHSNAHYRATDSHESPGRTVTSSIAGGVRVNDKHNLDV